MPESAQRGDLNPLVRLRGAGNQSAGKIFRQSFITPLLSEQARIAARHVDDARGVFQLRQRRPVVRLRMMAGREDHIRRTVAAGERAAESRGRRERCRNARHNFKGHTRFGQCGNLLGSAAKDQRIATLEPHNRAACAARVIISSLISACVIFFSPQRLPTLAISAWGEARRRIGCGTRSSCRMSGGLKEAQSLDCEQLGIAGTGSDQVDLTLRLGAGLRQGRTRQQPGGASGGSAERALGQSVQQSLARFTGRLRG